MALCPRCGEDNPERARFCLACGTGLAAPTTAATETRKVVTTLFTDVTGSTSLGERLDPESLRTVMGRYFEEARGVVERHGGTVEKFIGDAVMAVFGIPQVHEDDALRAVRAALEINAALSALNEELEASYGVRLELRTGVHTGEVAVGGGEVFATGDAVNVAARLEQDAAPGQILIGETTQRLVRDAVELEEIEPLTLKGKARPVAAWLVVGLRPEGTPERRRDPPLVGRERELEQLHAAYDDAVAAGSCRLVTVLGAAGIGKSRLVRELVRTVEGEARVLFGRCLPYGEGITYWPLADVVRRAAGIDTGLSAADALARVTAIAGPGEDAELVARRVAGAIGLGERGAPSEEIFWAFRRLLEALAQSRPLVLVFDDIHWAEPTFLGLVEYVVARMGSSPVLIVCMARPELLEERPDWGAAAAQVALEPLDAEASEHLIESRGAEGTIDADLRARIAAAADGNPLFVEELVASLVEGGGTRGATLPPTIQALLAARLDRLESGDHDVLARASVVGQEFERGAVAELAGRETVDDSLAVLVRRDIVRPQPASADGFRFRHLLIRDAAYGSMPRALRAALHERYARYLERAVGERVGEVEEIVGYHFEQAYEHRVALGPPDKDARAVAREAARRFLNAAGRADAHGDLPAAVNLLDRTLALLDADDAERPGAQAFLGSTLLESGQLEGAQQHLVAAEAAARASGQRAVELAAGVALSMVRVRTDPGFDLGAATEVVERAIPEVEQLGDDALSAQVWRVLVIARMITFDLSAVEAAASRVVELSRRAGQPRIEAEALHWLSLSVSIGKTPSREAIRRCDELLAQSPGPLSTASVLTAVAGPHAMLGDIDEARRLIALGRAGFRDLGFLVNDEGGAALVDAYIELHAGETEAAERILHTSGDALEAMRETAALMMQQGQRAWILARLGRPEEALALSERAMGPGVAYQFALRAQAAAYLQLGRRDEAEGIARGLVAAVAGLDDFHTRAEMHELLADALAAGGQTQAAEQELEQAAVLYEQKECLVCAGRVRSRLAAHVG